MLRSPFRAAQALARPSHCVHTLWAHIEGITHNAEVVGNKIFKKRKNTERGGAHTSARTPRKQENVHTLW